MADSDLLFNLPAPASPEVVFGGDATDTPSTVDVTITGAFPALTVSAQVVPIVNVEITGSFAPLSVTCSMQYRSNTARPTVGHTGSEWEQGANAQQGTASGLQDAISHPEGWECHHTLATPAPAGIESLLPSIFKSAPESRTSSYERAIKDRVGASFEYQEGDRTLRLLLNDAYEAAAIVRNSTGFRHQNGDHTKRTSRSTRWQPAQWLNTGRTTDHQTATPQPRYWASLFDEAMRPTPGISLPPTIPVEPPFTCYTRNGELVFEAPWVGDGKLLFKCDGDVTPPGPEVETIIVPVREVYIVLNNVFMRRVSDNALVNVTAMSLSLDVDSWTWSFSASVPAEHQGLVEPTSTGPVELKCSVNGTEFRVLAEKVSRERSFGSVSLRISGRGINARLDSPYAPTLNFGNEFDRTAQQLMNDALTFNGVSLGYTINWAMTDWLVPAGVFSHQGNYISALGAIAQSAGGYLLPHPTAKSFTIKHRYPVAPWNWSSVTPDFALPSAVTTRESMEWVEKPAYNRVYVSGQRDGILGRVTRAGTDGAINAQMVVDQLITEAAAARQRGLSILADTGRQMRIGLRLPVLAETGIIQPGAFVRYEDAGVNRIGIVRGTSIDTKLADVWQSLEVETHL